MSVESTWSIENIKQKIIRGKILIAFFMDRLTFYSGKLLKSATPSCTDFKL